MEYVLTLEEKGIGRVLRTDYVTVVDKKFSNADEALKDPLVQLQHKLLWESVFNIKTK
jgi:hypothetical protein